jgi:hypothetical protein
MRIECECEGIFWCHVFNLSVDMIYGLIDIFKSSFEVKKHNISFHSSLLVNSGSRYYSLGHCPVQPRRRDPRRTPAAGVPFPRLP